MRSLPIPDRHPRRPPAPSTAAVRRASPSRAVQLSAETYRPGQEVTVRVREKSREFGKLTAEQKRRLPYKVETGVLVGHSAKGEGVVELRSGRREHASFEDIRALESGAPPQPRTAASVRKLLYEGISPDSILSPPVRLERALKRALSQPVDGTQGVGPGGKGIPAQAYVDALLAEGHQVLVVGGAIRDTMQALHQNPKISDADLLSKFADIDLITTASPAQIAKIVQRLGAGLPNSGLWTDRSTTEEFGIVGVGKRKTGLDIQPLRLDASSKPRAVLGFRLLDDMKGRDFTFNQLVIDLRDFKLVDPSGRGLRDAISQRIIPNRAGLGANESLYFRYLKFRARGGHGTRTARTELDEHGHALMSKPTPRAEKSIVANYVRTLPTDLPTRRAVREYLEQLAKLAAKDGLRAHRFVTPLHDAVVETYAAKHGLRR